MDFRCPFMQTLRVYSLELRNLWVYFRLIGSIACESIDVFTDRVPYNVSRSLILAGI